MSVIINWNYVVAIEVDDETVDVSFVDTPTWTLTHERAKDITIAGSHQAHMWLREVASKQEETDD